jgi:hypothetical protein
MQMAATPGLALVRLAQATCFTTEGSEFVERCAPLMRATADGQLAVFVSWIGVVLWSFVLGLTALALWLLLRRSSGALMPRWAAWLFVLGCGLLLLAPLDKLWDEGYAEGVGGPAVGVLSQYLPSLIGDASARGWLGSSGSSAQAVGQLVNQAFMAWAAAMLVASALWLRHRDSQTSDPERGRT